MSSVIAVARVARFASKSVLTKSKVQFLSTIRYTKSHEYVKVAVTFNTVAAEK